MRQYLPGQGRTKTALASSATRVQLAQLRTDTRNDRRAPRSPVGRASPQACGSAQKESGVVGVMGGLPLKAYPRLDRGRKIGYKIA